MVCALYPNVHFIVGGDGNKKLLLEEMRVSRMDAHNVVQLRVIQIEALCHALELCLPDSSR
jgi:hypothetical protein